MRTFFQNINGICKVRSDIQSWKTFCLTVKKQVSVCLGDWLLKFFIRSNEETVLFFFLCVLYIHLCLWLHWKFVINTWTVLVMTVTSIYYLNHWELSREWDTERRTSKFVRFDPTMLIEVEIYPKHCEISSVFWELACLLLWSKKTCGQHVHVSIREAKGWSWSKLCFRDMWREINQG